MLSCVEYLWLDGARPTQRVRSKTRILALETEKVTLKSFPLWGFDGSSTYQASGNDSDLILHPVCFVNDSIRGPGNFIVLCEVLCSDDSPHPTNARATLRKILDDGADEVGPWIGFEQEYTLFQNNRPYGWPEHGFPSPQGPFYCGVGSEHIYGRQVVERHTQACIHAGILIFGINAEVMPGQWEFQIGYRGVFGETPEPLIVSDHLWIARWLLERVAEDMGIWVNFENKPVKGDWNGAGTHANFSTRQMRDKKSGWSAILEFVDALSRTHDEHIAVYGHGLSQRLTGKHETCDIQTFKAGEKDRGASVRIPDAVVKDRCGYIEDRRPGANCDPYKVSARLLKTLMDSKKHEKSGQKEKKSSATELV